MTQANLWPIMTAERGEAWQKTLADAANSVGHVASGITNYPGGGGTAHTIREAVSMLDKARADIADMTPDNEE